MGMNMDQYTAEFTATGVDGLQLLHLDSDKLKVKTQERLLLDTTPSPGSQAVLCLLRPLIGSFRL